VFVFLLAGVLLIAPRPHSAGEHQLSPAGESDDLPPDREAGRPGPFLPSTIYTMSAALEPDGRTIRGELTVLWTNRARIPLEAVRLHLPVNAFEHPDTFWMRDAPELASRLARNDGWGGTEIPRVKLDGVGASLRVPDVRRGVRPDRTVVEIVPPSPLPPGAISTIELTFVTRLPVGAPHAGISNGFVGATGWFPRLAPLDPEGWRSRPARPLGESFGDFADFDVRLDFPERLKVAAVGVESGPPVSSASGRQLHRFRARQVTDFVWFADERFERISERVGSEAEPGRELEIELFVLPEHAGQGFRYLAALRASVAAFEKLFGPYPWPRLTAVDPPIGSRMSGMEYPTLVLLGTRSRAPTEANQPEALTFHEVAHQWFHAQVASDEQAESWLDEGLATWAANRELARIHGADHAVFSLFGWPFAFLGLPIRWPEDAGLDVAAQGRRDSAGAASWSMRDEDSFRAASYSRTALALASLERRFGVKPVEGLVAAWIAENRFRRADGRAFRELLHRTVGAEADALFGKLAFGDGVLDYAVTRIDVRPGEGPIRLSTVEVSREGEIAVPVDVELVLSDGTKIRQRWTGEERWIRFTVRGAAVLSASVDPDHELLVEAETTDNSLRLVPDRRAAAQWSLRLLTWLQGAVEMALVFG
jgi:hypothetical protein